jgi:hypothetical protein
VSGAFPDNTLTVGLNNTFGIETIHFPDSNNPFGNPCGGWVQLWNSMRNQGINVNKMRTKYRVGGARRFNGLVAQRRGFPLACRELRKQKLFLGTRLGPNNPFAPPSSNSGLPNVAFIQVFPQYSADLINCIRDEYASLPSAAFTSLPLIAKTKVYGIADNGDRFRSNTIRYTLTLQHVCGNGRIDNFEECDPTVAGAGGAPATQCTFGAVCAGGECVRNPTRACASSADCIGTCADQGARNECSCVY